MGAYLMKHETPEQVPSSFWLPCWAADAAALSHKDLLSDISNCPCSDSKILSGPLGASRSGLGDMMTARTPRIRSFHRMNVGAGQPPQTPPNTRHELALFRICPESSGRPNRLFSIHMATAITAHDWQVSIGFGRPGIGTMLMGHSIRVISLIRVSEAVCRLPPQGPVRRLFPGQKCTQCGAAADSAPIILDDQAEHRRSQRFRDHPRRASDLAYHEVSP